MQVFVYTVNDSRGLTALDAHATPRGPSKTMKPRFDEIVGLVDAVCRTHLTDEYAALTRELAATVARKRPSPLLRGQSRVWACGLTYTIGSVKWSPGAISS